MVDRSKAYMVSGNETVSLSNTSSETGIRYV